MAGSTQQRNRKRLELMERHLDPTDMDVQMQDAKPSTSAVQIDAAKLEAIRKATLNSYKNKFLNLRDKFDKVNATNTEYTTTLANAKKKEDAIQDEINMLLDYLAQHAASEPEIARCLTRPPSLPQRLGMNGS